MYQSERRKIMSNEKKGIRNTGLRLIKKGQKGILHAVFSRFGIIILIYYKISRAHKRLFITIAGFMAYFKRSYNRLVCFYKRTFKASRIDSSVNAHNLPSISYDG